MKPSLKERVSSFFSRNTERKRWKQLLIDFFIVIFSVGIFCAGGLVVWASTLEIPDFENFDNTLVSESTKIYDRTGEVLLYDVYGDVKRTSIPLEDVAPQLKNATIALEDSRFYEHVGVRPDAIIRAAWANINSGELSEGGSTITQQVVKNTLLTNDKNFVRKAKEAIIALKMERILTKNEILETYLNVIPYGGSVYGAEEASLRFFGKSASDLTLAESAYLASLPKAPTYYSPYGNNREELEQRKNYTLDRMLSLGYINQSEHQEATNEEITFADPEQKNIKAPHFALYVLSQLEEEYGRDMIERSGLKVTTTLDYELYQKSQDIVQKAAIRNERINNAENMGMIGIDPKTGQILLMVGSRNYFSEDIDGKFNVTISHNRQPGSSFKPIVYSAAFEKGYTPETMLFDLPTQFSTACGAFQTNSECGYSPQNYDEKFRGPISMRNALAQSVNIPAVKTLYLSGIDNVLANANAMGIKELKDKDEYGLSLGLGAAQLSVLDMASAYSTFANQGRRHEPTSILKITDRNNEVLKEYEEDSTQVIDKQAALKISSVLSDNPARTPLYGANSPLYFGGRPVAGKTGTTNNYVDAWTIGYNKNFALAAWVGNNDNSRMAEKVSGLIITPTWRDVMDEALTEYSSEEFEEPEATPSSVKPILRGVWNPQSTQQASSSDDFLSSFLENTRRRENTTSDVHSILHYVDKNNPRGPAPSSPSSDRQYGLWEPQVRAWIENGGGVLQEGENPNDNSNSNTDNFRASIISPTAGASYDEDENITISITANNDYEIDNFDAYVNAQSVGNDDDEPFEISFTPEDLSGIQEENTVRVIATNEDGDRSIDSVKFNVNQ